MSADDRIPGATRGRVVEFVRRYPRVRLWITLAGNTLFLAGSICLVAGLKTASQALWVVGSAGMWLGAVGAVLQTVERRELRHRGVDLSQGGP